jgi:hypothetical protein
VRLPPRGFDWVTGPPGSGGARFAGAILLGPPPYPAFLFPVWLTQLGCGFIFWRTDESLLSGIRRWGEFPGNAAWGHFQRVPDRRHSKEIHSSGKQNARTSVVATVICLQGGVSREDRVGKNPDGVCALTNDFPLPGAKIAGGGGKIGCSAFAHILGFSSCSESEGGKCQLGWLTKKSLLTKKGKASPSAQQARASNSRRGRCHRYKGRSPSGEGSRWQQGRRKFLQTLADQGRNSSLIRTCTSTS